MSLHLEAKPGMIAPTVFITGDPLRARFFAKGNLKNISCYNQVRGMLGYTGTYDGHSISIQGTGIGIPSTALYVHELIHDYHVKQIIRIGTCGAIKSHLVLGNLIIGSRARTDSAAIDLLLGSPTEFTEPDTSLLLLAQQVASNQNIQVQLGEIFSTDLFYADHDPTRWKSVANRNVLAVEMETCMLYAMAKKNNIKALSILTVSDNIITGEMLSATARETNTTDMVKLALILASRSSSG